MMMRHQVRRREMIRELKLTSQQREKIADIRETLQRKAIGLRAELNTALLDLRHQLRVDQPDRATIDHQIDTIAHLRAELRKSGMGAVLDMRGVLTPDQRKKTHDRIMGMSDCEDSFDGVVPDDVEAEGEAQ